MRAGPTTGGAAVLEALVVPDELSARVPPRCAGPGGTMCG